MHGCLNKRKIKATWAYIILDMNGMISPCITLTAKNKDIIWIMIVVHIYCII